MAAVIIVVEAEVTLEGVGADHVVATVGEAKDDAPGGVLASRDRLEAHADIDVAVGAARRDDDVELVLGGALHQRSAAMRLGDILDRPFASDRLPAVEWL